MSDTPVKDPAIIKLENVRLSFPQLFTPKAVQKSQEPKFSATFLLDTTTHAALLKQIDATIQRLALDKWKKKIGFKSCLKDGNDKPEIEGYGDGVMFVSSSSKRRPVVVDRKRDTVVETDGVVYAGCYVNATVRLWVQDNEFGKRVNAELRAVQFFQNGDSFGAGPVDAEEEFDEVKDELDEF